MRDNIVSYAGNVCNSPSLVVICTYQLIITVTGIRSHKGQGFNIGFSSDPTAVFRLNMNRDSWIHLSCLVPG